MAKQGKKMMDETEKIDWKITVVVEPALSGIEDTGLVTFEYKEKKIEFKENKGIQNNETELSIQLKSNEENRKKDIDDLMSYFLGRFELDGTRSYHYRIQNIKNLKTGIQWAETTLKIYKKIDTEFEMYIQKIDNFSKASNDEKIAKSIREFHYADRAISPNHAYLSMANAIYPLIEAIGNKKRTSLSGLNACWKLFNQGIIKTEREEEEWDNEIIWIHDTIDAIRYMNILVDEKAVERIRKSYKEFIDMYIRYNEALGQIVK